MHVWVCWSSFYCLCVADPTSKASVCPLGEFLSVPKCMEYSSGNTLFGWISYQQPTKYGSFWGSITAYPSQCHHDRDCSTWSAAGHPSPVSQQGHHKHCPHSERSFKLYWAAPNCTGQVCYWWDIDPFPSEHGIIYCVLHIKYMWYKSCHCSLNTVNAINCVNRGFSFVACNFIFCCLHTFINY